MSLLFSLNFVLNINTRFQVVKMPTSPQEMVSSKNAYSRQSVTGTVFVKNGQRVEYIYDEELLVFGAEDFILNSWICACCA